MQNSSHALKSKKKEKPKRGKSSQKRRRIRLKTKIIKIKNETRVGKNNISINRPLYLYTDKKTFLLLKRTYFLQEIKKRKFL